MPFIKMKAVNPKSLTALVMLAMLAAGRTSAFVALQSLQVAHPSSPQLFYRNRNIDDERYTASRANPSMARRDIATPPMPLMDAEPKHVLVNDHYETISWGLSDFRLPEFRFSLFGTETGINFSMMKNMAVSQVTMLSLTTAIALAVTTCMDGTFLDSLNWMTGTTAEMGALPGTVQGQILLGAISATPMIFLSQGVDQATSAKDASHAHFATTNMVLTLFGRRRKENTYRSPETTSTMEVILSSFALASLTSLTEEIMFRGFIPTAIAALTNSMALAWIVQGIVFGASHIHPEAHEGENRVVAATQTLNALLGYGLVATTGGLVPCIIAHALYDMHVLVSSWYRVNQQMDWTEDRVQQKFTDEDISSLRELKDWAGPSLTSESLSICRRFFYAFDEDHKNALSLSNVHRATSYAFLSDEQQPTAAMVTNEFRSVLFKRQHIGSVGLFPDRLTLAEFVKVLFSLRASLQNADSQLVER